ncbi:hypothetical protein ACTX06_19535, partial [Pseudomonas aeruginosa]|uniref:hypothetical protein n=1 Tax=Pseudomonas aeruginosa TaxID=287 RepID=UPI003FD5E44E
AGLLALAGVLGVGEGHLLHRKALRVKSADFAKSGSLFQSFPNCSYRPDQAEVQTDTAHFPMSTGFMKKIKLHLKHMHERIPHI